MHAITCMARDEGGCDLLLRSGGAFFLLEVLHNMNSTGKYHEVPFENTSETLFELTLQCIQNLVLKCNVHQLFR